MNRRHLSLPSLWQNATLEAERQATQAQLKQLESQSERQQAQILALQRQAVSLQENNTALQTHNANLQVHLQQRRPNPVLEGLSQPGFLSNHPDYTFTWNPTV